MPIPTPSPPSAGNAISSVTLNPTQNNKAFYVFSGEVDVTTTESTMISINDIGKRDIIFCFELGTQSFSGADTFLKVKSNGATILTNSWDDTYQKNMYGFNEVKLILPANTSLEITLTGNAGTVAWTVAGYGYYLETFR